MRFLFINPPNRKLINDVNKAVLPLGLAYLGASLLEDKVEVKILDAVIEDFDHHFEFRNRTYYGLDLEGIRREIVDYRPDVVGVSCLFTPVSEISKEICSIAKACKVRYTAVGGPTPSALPNLFITSPSVDFIFIGESERTITRFAEAINQGNDHDLFALDGFVCKSKDGNIVHNPKTSFIQNLDEIPLPARHLLPMEKYFRVSSPQGGVYKSRRNTPIITSRGCTGKCCFCASTNVWGKGYRSRSADNVAEEVARLKREYNIEEFQIQDDNFTFNKKRTLEICDKIKGLGMYWSMPNGVAVWSLDEDRIKAMSESGCHYVIAAIESGNPRVLKEVIRKPLNLDKAIEVCKCIRRYGIRLSGFFIVGFPGETLEEIKDTFRYAARCNLDIANFNYATPLPSSPLWEQAERENLFVDGFDLANITYDRPSLRSKNWTLDELQSLVLSESRMFYFKVFLRNPRVILFRILDSLKKDPVELLRIIYFRLIGKEKRTPRE